MPLAKKVQLIIASLALALSLGVGALLYHHDRLHEQQLVQQSNASLAANLVANNLLYQDGLLVPEALSNIFQTMMVINPAIGVYLLEGDGSVYMHSAPTGVSVASPIPTKTLASAKWKKLFAAPDAALSRLHSESPAAISPAKCATSARR